MDADHDWTLTEIIYFLKSALGLAEYELSQNTGAVEDKEAFQDKNVVEGWELLKDEEGNEAYCEPSLKLLKNTPIDKRNAQKFPRPQYGKYNLDIHYTLGRGVPEALEDDVDGAGSVVLFRRFVDSGGADVETKQKILIYNEDDCMATMFVFDWLLAQEE